MTAASVEISARYLDRDERYEIARLREAGHGVREIGRLIGRSPATVSRELRRNTGCRSRGRYRPEGGDRYEPERAHTLATQRRARPKQRKLERNGALRQWVQDRLEQMDSPEQISGRLKMGRVRWSV